MRKVNPRWETAPMELGYIVSPHLNHSLVRNEIGLYVDPNRPPLRATEDGQYVPPFIEEQPDGTIKEVW